MAARSAGSVAQLAVVSARCQCGHQADLPPIVHDAWPSRTLSHKLDQFLGGRSKRVTISRAKGSLTFPASFMLVAAMNRGREDGNQGSALRLGRIWSS